LRDDRDLDLRRRQHLEDMRIAGMILGDIGACLGAAGTFDDPHACAIREKLLLVDDPGKQVGIGPDGGGRPGLDDDLDLLGRLPAFCFGGQGRRGKRHCECKNSDGTAWDSHRFLPCRDAACVRSSFATLIFLMVRRG
jgi:hypothetical protein